MENWHLVTGGQRERRCRKLRRFSFRSALCVICIGYWLPADEGLPLHQRAGRGTRRITF